MALILKSNDTLNDPSNVIPYIEKDAAIVRGVTLGMIDLSNAHCKPVGISDGQSVPVGAALKTLTNGGSDAVVRDAAFNLGITGGGLNASTSGALSAAVTLPDSNFRLPAAASGNRILVVGWAKLKSSGYLTGQGNLSILIWGDCSNTGNNIGHFMVQIDTSGNVTTGSRFQMYGMTTNSAVGSALIAKFDGQVRQFAVEGVYVGTTMTLNVYVDKVLIGTTTGSVTTPHTGGVNSQRLFSTNVFNAANGIHSDNKLYRYAVHNLTARPELTAAIMLQRDWDATAAYLEA